MSPPAPAEPEGWVRREIDEWSSANPHANRERVYARVVELARRTPGQPTREFWEPLIGQAKREETAILARRTRDGDGPAPHREELEGGVPQSVIDEIGSWSRESAIERSRPLARLIELADVGGDRSDRAAFWSEKVKQVKAEFAPALRVADVAASHIGGTAFAFRVEVLSVQGPLVLPSRAAFVCPRCRDREEIEVDLDGYVGTPPRSRASYLRARLAEKHDLVTGGKCRPLPDSVRPEEAGLLDYSILTVADLPGSAAGPGSFDDTRLPVHLVGVRPPVGGSAKITARPFVEDPSSRRIALVAHEFAELESKPRAPVMDGPTREALAGIGRLPMERLREQIAPGIVGRPTVKEGRIYLLLSVGKIPDVDGTIIEGTLKEALIGDTTTGKSASAKDTAKVQGFGPFLQAENAGRTGLLYSITESSSGGFVLTWGTLPRASGRYAVIDGLEEWSEERQGEIRAVLRDQEVRVDRVVRGSRPVVLRITITANPKKAVKRYAFRCQAIRDTRPFRNEPDVARIDMFHVYSREDVAKKDVAARRGTERPIDDGTFAKLVFWAWSRAPGQISYTPGACDLIRSESERIMEALGSAVLPVVSDGFRDTLCRVAVAVAVRHFSTADGETVVVERDHVVEAVAFLERIYSELDLAAYVAHEDRGAVFDGGDAVRIISAIGNVGVSIIDKLAGGPMASKDLATSLESEGVSLTGKSIQHRYDDLRREGLIETQQGVGAELTPRGVALHHWIRGRGDGSLPVAGGPDLSPKRGTIEETLIPRTGDKPE